MSLTNPNTPVSQQDLQDFYHKLLPYMGGSFGLVATGIDSANLYSTTERVIGQWIDGKPVYQKTIDCGVMPNNNSKTVSCSIGQNVVEKIISLYGSCGAGNFNYPLPLIRSGDTEHIMIRYSATSDEVYILTSGNWSSYSGTVTLQYTKTTDSAVESYGTDTTYSTDEHVVGSWVDGSPIYQKSFKIVPANYGGSSSLVLPSSLTGLTNFLTLSHEIWDIYSEYYNTGVSSTRVSDNAILISGLSLNYPSIDHWITIRYKKIVSS